MKSRMTLTVGLLAVLVVSLAGTATAQPNCKSVKAHLSDYTAYYEPDACGGLIPLCRFASVKGTINGNWASQGAGYDFEFPTFGDTSVWRSVSIFETNHGVIDTMLVGINFWPTYDVVGDWFNSEIHVITGGTGRYEGATGYLLVQLVFLGGTGEATGQICWPEEPEE
jgi:hypothetical protein